MLEHVTFASGLVTAAFLFALVEVQVEGPHGWASRLPTWRYERPWTRKVLGARAVTGYHLYVHLFFLVMVHLPFILGTVRPSLPLELRILSFVILFWILQDFLWFVLNPSFGIARFRREYVWWHAPNWWGLMPRDYWLFGPLGVLLYVASWIR
jgi:hypothetical protein